MGDSIGTSGPPLEAGGQAAADELGADAAFFVHDVSDPEAWGSSLAGFVHHVNLKNPAYTASKSSYITGSEHVVDGGQLAH